MKTNKFFTLLAVALVSVVSFASCSDDDDVDNTAPTINLVAPAEGAILKIGGDVHFDAEFADDVLLGSYRVEIHNDFDGHSHTKSALAEGETVDFTFDKAWSFSGQKNADVHHHEIVIPENATPGKYHMMVYCLDAAGNETHVVRNIVLSHDGEDDDHDHDHDDHDHE